MRNLQSLAHDLEFPNKALTIMYQLGRHNIKDSQNFFPKEGKRKRNHHVLNEGEDPEEMVMLTLSVGQKASIE